jgi:hypothetical protein
LINQEGRRQMRAPKDTHPTRTLARLSSAELIGSARELASVLVETPSKTAPRPVS